VKFVSDFESTLLEIARESGCQGVICGHIHRPSIKCLGDILYCNTGDWVESCSALVEHSDGTMAIVRWDGRRIIEDMCERPLLKGMPSRENAPCTEDLLPV
jgi:predicted phosphodiesterase